MYRILRPAVFCLLASLSSLLVANPLFSGGSTSTQRSDQLAFSQPSANLTHLERLDFSVGNSFFRSPWVSAPASTTARDGLGPLFNTTACISCHIRDGRGRATGVGMLVRVSIPNTSTPLHNTLGVTPEPTYGTQIQTMALPGITPEAQVTVRYEELPVTFADGFSISLRKPVVELTELGYGPLHPKAQLSARMAPPMLGLGLLEAIPAEAILARVDPDDKNADGIRGVANWVWDHDAKQTALGRFGWKAGQPSLLQQNAHAFANDLGLTTQRFPSDDCTVLQKACRIAVNGGVPEVSANIEHAVLFYTRHLAVPMRRNLTDPDVVKGEQLFHQAGCAGCHHPSYITSKAAPTALANQTIYPYTDLLLHDMGEGLADHRPEFLANGRQWRTAPLWGLGLTHTVSGQIELLHDGRARSILEAILWHDGEARTAKEQVLNFNAAERQALLAFLNSL